MTAAETENWKCIVKALVATIGRGASVAVSLDAIASHSNDELDIKSVNEDGEAAIVLTLSPQQSHSKGQR